MSTIVLRSVKGLPLTNQEVDDNFSNLNTDKLQIGGTFSAGTANGVAFLNSSKVLTTVSALTFDGTNLGLNNGASITAAGATVLYMDANQTVMRGRATNGIIFQGNDGSEQMRLTSTGLGIGTSSPATKLHVYSTTARPITAGNASATWTFGPSGESFAFRENSSGSDFLTLSVSGNLGLGVTPSAWGGGIRVFEFGTLGGLAAASNDVNLISNVYFDGINRYRTNNFATNFQSTNGQFRWLTAPSGTAGNAISFTQAMTLDASGNLLVGTTSAAGRVTSNGGAGYAFAAFGGDSSLILKSINTAAGGIDQFFLRNNLGSVDMGTASGRGYLALFTDGSERARIDSSGNLLVGTTSGAGSNTGSLTFTPGTGAYNGVLQIQHSTSNISGSGYINFNYNGSAIGSVEQNGTTGVLYNTSSDYRLKTVIGPITNAGQRIDALQPVEYTWNASGERTCGFLAHQFQEVYAGSVSGTKDAVDAEGKPVYQSMQASTAEVIADLVAELQSLRARVAALESN